MLLFATFRFHRWGALKGGASSLVMPDFPLVSNALRETERLFSAAFSAASASIPPPRPGPLLLSRSCLSVSPSASSVVASSPQAFHVTPSSASPAEEPERERFYLTTAIAYTNGSPHMGHAYEYLAADAIARFYRFLGFDVHYVTGTDEHGMKIAEAAAKEGLPPRDFVGRYAKEFASLLDRLNSTHDFFVRTSSEHHYRVCQWLWNECKRKGDIYLGTYSGWYNPREETFIPERDAKAMDYRDPVSGNPLQRMQEESYFFRMGRCTDKP